MNHQGAARNNLFNSKAKTGSWGIGNTEDGKKKKTCSIFQSTTDDFRDRKQDYETFAIIQIEEINREKIIVFKFILFILL